MSHNLEYLLTRPGGLKIATIIFGIVAAILNSHSYAQSPYTAYYEDYVQPKNNTIGIPGTELELTNMTNTFIFLGISFVYLTAHSIIYAICESRLNKYIDVTYHMCGALLLFSGGITLIYSASHIERSGCRVFQLVSAGPTPKDHSFSEPSSPTFLSSLPSLLPFVPRKTGSERDATVMCHYFGEKIVGGSFNCLNGVLYGVLAFVIFSTEVEEL